MTNILKMVRLDLSMIKPYSKTLLIAFFAPVIIIYNTQDVIAGLVLCMSIMAMTSNYTFSIAEKNDLNRLYGLIPISKKDIVAGRYLFTALTGIVAVMLGTAINILVLATTRKFDALEDTVAAIGAGLTLYFVFTAIQLPAYFKFGAIKGRFISFIPFLGMFLAGIIGQSVGPESLEKLPDLAVLNDAYVFLVVSILFDIIVYGISMGIAQKIYEKMEL